MSSTLFARVGVVSGIGLLVWAVALVALSAPLAARILLLAPLVIAPRLLGLFPRRPWVGRVAGMPALAAALPLLVAFGLPAGALAAVFVLPWLALALVGVLAALKHGVANLSAILMPRAWGDLGVDVALGFWGVGAVFLLLDRLGVATGYAPVIVLLTAAHFHVAGLGLLGLASLIARSRPWLRLPVAGLIVGIPVTALGFVLASDAINATGALFVGVSGIGVGVWLLTLSTRAPAQWASRAAGVALLIGMPLAILWSVAILTGRTFLDLDAMIRTHGALNATAVLLGVLTFPSESS